VALQLTERDALGSHARDELGISETVTAHPLQAALVSALPIAVGAVLPLIVALLWSGFSFFAYLANSTAVWALIADRNFDLIINFLIPTRFLQRRHHRATLTLA
jgi:VIT1/CCC1 family predicted Fe2+/Mn2+ transporter